MKSPISFVKNQISKFCEQWNRYNNLLDIHLNCECCDIEDIVEVDNKKMPKHCAIVLNFEKQFKEKSDEFHKIMSDTYNIFNSNFETTAVRKRAQR